MNLNECYYCQKPIEKGSPKVTKHTWCTNLETGRRFEFLPPTHYHKECNEIVQANIKRLKDKGWIKE